MLSRAGGVYRVHTMDGMAEASLRGRMKQDQGKKVLVGDRVRLGAQPDGSLTIEDVLDRRSILMRRSPGRSTGTREVAANVDQVVVVGSIRDPDWSAPLMDRFTVVAEANRLPLILVINKIDLKSDPEEPARVYRDAGYRVILTSAKTGAGIPELKETLSAHTSLFTGPTGVGKSSLLNAVQPGLALRTGEVSRRSRAGRHTTVSAEMLPLDAGGFVVDTPGLRDIGLWGIDPQDVQRSFPEIAAAASDCRFDDCRHDREPDCAVRAAVESGRLAASRLKSFHQLLDEAEKAGRHWE